MAKRNPMTTVGILAVSVIAIAVVVYLVMNLGGTQQTIATGTCAIAPTISVTTVNALDKSVSISPGVQARVKNPGESDYQFIGSITTSTQFEKGASVELLLNLSNYIDTILDPVTVDCGVNGINAQMFATDDQTISIKTDAGTATLTDSATGGVTNETTKAAGGSYNWEVQFTGTDKQSSGSLIYVVEVSIPANVSSVTMSDSAGSSVEKLSSVPTGLTISGTNQERVAFRLPAFQNAVKKTYFLNVASASAKVVQGAVYTTAYSEQAFVETDGTFKVGVVNSDGTVKYEDDYDFDFWIGV